MSRTKKIITTAIALGIVALLVLALLPSPVPVTTTRVERGHFAEYVEDEGRTRLRDPYVVSAPISGYLHRVELEPGDPVDAGDVLFQLEAMPAPGLDPRSREQARESVAAARARLDAAEAELETRRSELELAETEYLRSERLHERELISTAERDRHRSRRDSARAAERGARHAVEVARFELQSARAVLAIADGERARDATASLGVPAPIAGTVTRRQRCCEGPIGAGEPILEIGDLSTLEVKVDLLSMDAVRLRPGMHVVLERWGEEVELTGRVRRVEPAGFERVSALGVEEQRVPVWVEITSPREDWAHLGDGYRVEARFLIWEDDDVVQIPSSALFREQEHWKVFVVTNGRAELRPVTTGRRSGLMTQIEDGLAEGEEIVTHPGDRIEHGTRVTPEPQRRR